MENPPLIPLYKRGEKRWVFAAIPGQIGANLSLYERACPWLDQGEIERDFLYDELDHASRSNAFVLVHRESRVFGTRIFGLPPGTTACAIIS